MKRLPIALLILAIFSRCGDNELGIVPNAKLKTLYIYSSSTASEPYSFTTYTYDANWNLIKELNSDYPRPPVNSYTYQYDSQGRLANKKYNGINGLNHSNQTESAFALIRAYDYQYVDDLQIEIIYRNDQLSDSIVYKRYNNLVLEEHHFDLRDDSYWSLINEYDENENLIKQTELPRNLVSEFEYDDSRLVRSTSYNENGEKVSELEYNYSRSGNKLIRECGFEKATFVNGNIIELIRYHPTFPGSEWWCHRYEYY